MARPSKIILLTTFLFSAAGGGLPADDPNLPVTYIGMCDASAAVAIDAQTFVVANDEDNTLRIYRSDAPGKAVAYFDVGRYLQLAFDNKSPEADFEAATRVNSRIYWITSHGRNREGFIRPNRHRLFAVDLAKNSAGDITFAFAGNAYKNLIQDLIQEPRMNGLGLRLASLLEIDQYKRLSPKKQGINIEGLAANPRSGALLIAFRNPRPKNRALIVVLENPDAVLLDRAKPKFGGPVLLDFNGLGIRSIEFSDCLSAYLIIAGSHKAQNRFKLFKWSGAAADQPVLLKQTEMLNKVRTFTPEALIVYQNEKRLHVLSDDGDVEISGPKSGSETKNKICRCKDLADPEIKTFRGLWIDLE